MVSEQSDLCYKQQEICLQIIEIYLDKFCTTVVRGTEVLYIEWLVPLFCFWNYFCCWKIYNFKTNVVLIAIVVFTLWLCSCLWRAIAENERELSIITTLIFSDPFDMTNFMSTFYYYEFFNLILKFFCYCVLNN